MTRRPPTISVVILTYRRPGLLEKCLASAAAADRRDVGEMIVAVNGSDQAGAALARSFRSEIAGLRVVELPRSSRGRGRNLAAGHAVFPVVHFLDDDAEVLEGTFCAVARNFLARPEIKCVGGPNLTPPASDPFQAAVGRVLSCRLGAWSMRGRYARVGAPRRADERTLMLCNLAFRREVFARGFGFDEDLVSAEENLLLERLGRAGGELFYDPELVVHHHRRASWSGFLSQTFKSGAGRMQAVLRMPSCLKPHHLGPSLFLLYLGIIARCAQDPAAWTPVVVYGAFVAREGLLYAFFEGGGWRGGLRVMSLAVGNHAAYGAGFLLGPFSNRGPSQAVESVFLGVDEGGFDRFEPIAGPQAALDHLR